MKLTEKAAYIKGLIEGMELDQGKKETKIINALVDIIDDIALTVTDTSDELAAVEDDLDDMDSCINVLTGDVRKLKEDMSFPFANDFCGSCDDCDYSDDFGFDDEELYEIECPECGKSFQFDESVLDRDEPLTCPHCGYVIDEIEIEDEDE